ncbi:Asp-tRNA(Asn)/Glu-tRNA(Gln) amidotransferase subunit GatB [Patescibacteria group bacterium]|nr:Asp-tRNA(Asn)/Glu-tRNA(Gln) amidotransferase subunit GatB [Patescibacteria group bacterium]
MPKLESIIGLEIHLELKTKSKFFCHCPNQETDRPNVNVCPICLGHPGVLPVLNKEVIKKALKLGLALNGQIAENCYFDRKNYFYPDLPKGYQISQYQAPLIKGGVVEIDSGPVALERIHLEEDTAKLFHQGETSLLDFNRAGVPLLEIVTQPEIKSPKQAKAFLEELQKIVRYLDISNADMEKGQLRCDANISLRPKGDKKYYPKAEIKNLNSFKAVEKALSSEIIRQRELWDKGSPPKYQTTRGWDEKKGITIEQRGKEEEKDYRYFPEPDLPPIDRDFLKEQGIDLEILKKDLSELPFARSQRFKREYGFDNKQAKLLTDYKQLANYTEKVISELKAWLLSLETVEGTEKEIWEKNKKPFIKLVANWLTNRLLALEQKAKQGDFKISPENFAEFIILIYEKKVSSNLGQKVLAKMFETGKDVDRVISEYQLKTVEDKKELNDIIKEVIEDNPGIVEKYKKGKHVVLQFLIGQVMKKTQGQAEPNTVKKLLARELKS